MDWAGGLLEDARSPEVAFTDLSFMASISASRLSQSSRVSGQSCLTFDTTYVRNLSTRCLFAMRTTGLPMRGVSGSQRQTATFLFYESREIRGKERVNIRRVLNEGKEAVFYEYVQPILEVCKCNVVQHV